MVYATFKTILLPLFRRKLAEVSGDEYLPPDGSSYLLAANHVDFLDGFYVAAAVYAARQHRVYFITKTNNYWWTKTTIPIASSRKAASVDDAFGYLKSGKIICNFIEGERNPNTRLLRGKTGVARLALVANVPVIPVGIIGSSSSTFVQSLTNLMAGGKDVKVHFGREVDLTEFRGLDIDYNVLQAATREIMRALVPLCGKAYAG
ncbi:MAG: 1-acyl-sn-glycerol-3-phosphate acyltransferase [Candidatus Kerfeldbacteria bacterium]|nr:1-acyl-sn-glycerol-3-phosphate acyltransferase [Candidatus Kerfeldbacteria bacterium]